MQQFYDLYIANDFLAHKELVLWAPMYNYGGFCKYVASDQPTQGNFVNYNTYVATVKQQKYESTIALLSVSSLHYVTFSNSHGKGDK